MKTLLKFAVACLLALLVVRPATAAMIDESLSYWNPYTGSCATGDRCFLQFNVLPELDYNGFEKVGVYNVEVFDILGNQIYLGTPRTMRLSFSRPRSTTVTLPASATWWFQWGIPVWFEVVVYASGPRFETSDSRSFSVLFNPTPPPPLPPLPPLLPPPPPPPPCFGDCGTKG